MSNLCGADHSSFLSIANESQGKFPESIPRLPISVCFWNVMVLLPSHVIYILLLNLPKSLSHESQSGISPEEEEKLSRLIFYDSEGIMEGLERKLMRKRTLKCLSLALTLSGSTPALCLHRYWLRGLVFFKHLRRPSNL